MRCCSPRGPSEGYLRLLTKSYYWSRFENTEPGRSVLERGFDQLGNLRFAFGDLGFDRLHQSAGNCRPPLCILAGEQVLGRFGGVLKEGVRCGEIELCDLCSRINQRTCQSVQRAKIFFLQFGELGRCRVYERLLQSD